MSIAPTAVSGAAGAQRWKVAATLGVTMLVAFYDRVNISLALPLIAHEQNWSADQKAQYGSLLIGLFYVGYGVANIFLSPLAARFGPRRSLLVIITLWSLFTALGAWVSQVLVLFLMARVLLGLSEGVHLPMMSQITKSWFPLHERSRANSTWMAGIFVAVVSASMLLVPIMNAYGWRAGFFVLAAGGGLVSLPLVLFNVFDRPEQHPRISDSELLWLREQAADEVAKDASLDRAGLLDLLRRPAFLCMTAAGTLNNVVALGITSWLPTYLEGEKGVRYQDLAWLAAVPYVTSLLGLVTWSQIGDRTNWRGYCGGVGYLLAGLCVWLALTADSLEATLFFFAAGTFGVSAFNACEFAMVQRIAPVSRVATASGVYNGFAAIVGGGLGPYIVSGIISGGRSTGAILPIVAVCVLASASLAALGRIVRY